MSETVAEEACHHHWMLASPAGDSTSGVCKNCGQIRKFNDAYQAPSRNTSRTAAKPKATT